jgi:DNA-binding transcriptional MocR family regulator
MMVHVDPSQPDTLTGQIVTGIQRLVANRELRPETRLPSIRRFAADHNVSTFTVVQAYDRLVATGHVHARRGAGFFVNRTMQSGEPVEGGLRLNKATDVLWLIHQQTRELCFKHLPGGGWLPAQWLKESGLNRAMRELSRRGVGSFLSGYGDPRGFAPLRADLKRRLAEFGIDAPTDQILLTNGISGGIDLVGRYLVRPNDVVFVDDPGYYQTFGQMRALGAIIHGVPWTDTGPDLEQLESMVRTHRPRLFVTTSIVQNPTGYSISQGTAFRLLRLAERYDFYIVEDDVDGAYHPDPRPRLAGLDQLNRVIYMCGFSKALSPRLRVGAVAAHRDLIRDLVDLKMLTQMASSEFTEKLVHEVLAHGQFRKHRAKLLDNLHQFRGRAIRRLEAIGIGPVGDDTHGLFAWMDIPGVTDTTPLAEAAIKRGIVLAPGAMFSPYMTSSTKMRFNVTYCRDDAMFRELETLLSTATNT